MDLDVSSDLHSYMAVIKKLTENLNAARKDQKFCDFTLKSNDGKNIPVHKIVLISMSSFFEKMFNSGMLESRQDSMILEKVTGEKLEKVIEYMYTGKLEVDAENATEILDIALFLGLNDLTEYCTKTLIASIGKENIWDLLKYGKTIILTDDVWEACFEWILRNIETVINSEELNQLSFEDIQTLMERKNQFNYCEDTFHSIIMKWIKYDLETRQIYTQQLIDLLNFELMSKKYLQSDEMIETSKYLNNKSYLIRIIKCIGEDSEPKYKQLKNSPTVCSTQQSLYAVTRNSIFKLDPINLELKLLTKHTSKSTENISIRNFACVGFEKCNIFICGGTNDTISKTVQVCQTFKRNHGFQNSSSYSRRSESLKSIAHTSCQVYSTEKQTWIYLSHMDKSMVNARAVYSQNKIYIYDSSSNHIDIFCLVKCSWLQELEYQEQVTSMCALNDRIYSYLNDGLYRFNEETSLWDWLSIQSEHYPSEIFGYDHYIYQFTQDGYCIFDLKKEIWFIDFAAYKADLENEEKCKINTFVDRANICLYDTVKGQWLVKIKPYMGDASFEYVPRACLCNDEIYLYSGNTVKVYKALNLTFCREFSIPNLEDQVLEHLIAM